MDSPQLYIIIAIVVLIITGLVVFFVKGQKPQKLSTLAIIAFGFILAGILFNENETFAYSMIGAGIVVAIIDMIKKLKKKK